MNRILIFLVSGVCFFSTLTANAAEKLKLTLEKAKEIALEQNPTLAQAQANIAAAAAAVESAKSSYYPSVNLTGGVTRVRDYPTRPERDYDNHTVYAVGLSASWSVFDGGARHFNYLIAKLGGDMALAACDDARRMLLQNVAYAFFVVMQSQNSMEIAQQDADYNRQLHDDAQKKFDLGAAKKSEVLNFEYQVGKAEVNFIEAQRTWRNACVALGQLLVIQQDAIWDNIELVPPAQETVNAVQEELIKQLDFAAQHRPDLMSAQQNVARAGAQLDLAKAGWYPKVNVFYNYDFQRSGSAHFNTHYDRGVNFGVEATWNLFNGFGTEASIRQAEAEVTYYQKVQEQLQQSVDAEVRQDWVALDSSRRTLDKQNELLKIAKDIRELVHTEYLGGTATITRVNEVQTNLTNTALARSTAYVEVLNNLEKLNSATGRNLK